MLQRGGIRDHRHRAVGRRPPEQQPRIRLFLFGLGERGRECKAALVEKRSSGAMIVGLPGDRDSGSSRPRQAGDETW